MRIILFFLKCLFLWQYPYAQQITVLNLVNAGNNSTIGALSDGDTININSTPDFSVEALAANTGSVVFNLNGPAIHTQTESSAPYVLFGDNGGISLPGTIRS